MGANGFNAHRRRCSVDRALVLEDDRFAQMMFGRIIRNRVIQLEPIFATNVADAQISMGHIENIRLIIADVFLEGPRSGIDFYKFLIKTKGFPPVIFTSSISEWDFRQLLGESLDPPRYLQKPFSPQLCANLINQTLNRGVNLNEFPHPRLVPVDGQLELPLDEE